MHSFESLRAYLPSTLDRTDFTHLGKKLEGKVRDVYVQEDKRILIATDRQSAFDVQWCTIPLKGQVLNQVSAWWFHQVEDVMPNHVVSVPDPNVTVVKNLQMLPMEIVVRGYITGSTNTSAWVNYEKGMRTMCGNQLPDGLRKHEKLKNPILTPTTKAEEDELISPEQILKRGLATQAQWEEIAYLAFKLFARGQYLASKRGLILVDTKYEMGLDEHGGIVLADEVHTPDSSRYWVESTYEERFASGKDPESLDKEFFRLWLREQGYQGGEKKPEVTNDIRLQLAARYIDLYERMTGERFELQGVRERGVEERIRSSLQVYEVPASARI
ncbi:phosphoribosylaminoimidazolesuccinocarboxamide synthase [Candidatus Peregrinibacteria bacterium CG10_big_fil_rev_8_21_14_0_10_49_16]|nr:MAG: phosphoribosylaminoimidazolesuccinocarboxamide synthase [Candidatus Peregrinibacteria bacterium CG10_big_fil_rev_8_21_14_0_10_49_16]